MQNRILSLNGDIKAMVRWMRKKGMWFGWMDEDDLVQEAFVWLLRVVPETYNRRKGDFKKYCMTLVYRVIRIVSIRMSAAKRGHAIPDVRIVSDVDFDSVTDDALGGCSFVADSMIGTNEAFESLCERSIQGMLDELAAMDEDWKAVTEVYRNGSVREAARELGVSVEHVKAAVGRVANLV